MNLTTFIIYLPTLNFHHNEYFTAFFYINSSITNNVLIFQKIKCLKKLKFLSTFLFNYGLIITQEYNTLCFKALYKTSTSIQRKSTWKDAKQNAEMLKSQTTHHYKHWLCRELIWHYVYNLISCRLGAPQTQSTKIGRVIKSWPI